MANPGHRSFGCTQCRRSKVKCDEARPACGRCVRSGKICSGYQRRTPPSSTACQSSKARVLRERLEASQLQSQRAVSLPILEGPNESTTSTSATTSSTSLPPPLSLGPLQASWTEQSVSFLFAENVCGPDHLNSTWGTLEYLPRLYSKARTTYLTYAVHAAALAYMANASSVTELEKLARHSYGKALEGLASAMNNPALIEKDETLAATNLLAMYEMIAGQQHLTELFHAHFSGQSVILHFQKKQAAKCNTLFGSVNRQLMWRDLAARTRSFLCVSDWPTSTYSSSLAERTARFTLNIVDICGRVKELCDLDEQEKTANGRIHIQGIFTDLSRDAVQLHIDIREYLESISIEWKPYSLPYTFPSLYPLDRNASVHSISNLVSTVPGWGAAGGTHLRSRPTAETSTQSCPSRIDIYPTRPVAFLWCTLRCAWLHLSRSFVDLQLFANDLGFTDAAAAVDLPSIESAYNAVTELIEDICAAVPYMLGDVSEDGKLGTTDTSRSVGFWLLWLLHRVCVIPGLEPGLRAWIVSVLERIGNRGLKRVLFLARLHAD